ncbi:hypothetical protein BDN72DRAFT_754946 [Pluteus cervinus]|uniref:Uncharacterized protein n=1 Tax=Pluteus cervinus TaxID=181527 RepID=A0ACD3BGF1_9AGAR|nr:hypothetical protein BDN72DRAFT_754946 [Pluteus cervinus]
MQGSSSSEPPPPFQDEDPSSSIPLDSLPDYGYGTGPGQDVSPPEFTPYEAEFFLVANDDVVSHDPHLNGDGEALYRFLLSQSQSAPMYRLSCQGSHTEMRSHWVAGNGRSEGRNETRSETVIDFDFSVEIGGHIEPRSVVQWSVPDNEPVYRGKMIREVEDLLQPSSDDGIKRRAATKAEIKTYKEWLGERRALGLPPWVGQNSRQNFREGTLADERVDVLRSSKTVRDWADEYCASPKYLKEFVYEKIMYGWNLQQLESAIRSSIISTNYHGDLRIYFVPYSSKVYIRPDNKISRMLSNKWLKFLSIITLIFPFIWLFKRFHSRGGGRWEVCGGAYALKRPAHAGEESTSSLPSGKGQPQTALTQGTSQIIGIREGEWFRKWEPTITRAVTQRYQSPTPFYTPTTQVQYNPGHALDGY